MAASKTFTIAVSSAHDGDTWTATDGAKVRAHNADAPELGQPFGREARNRLRDLIVGKTLLCTRMGESRGRIVARCRTVDGADPMQVMVASGLAWNDRAFGRTYEIEEATAARAGIGLWSQPAIPPWTWRLIRR